MVNNRDTNLSRHSAPNNLREAPREDALDALLAYASNPLPPENLEEEVLAAIRRDEAPAPLLHSRPWYGNRRVWLTSAAAACLFAVLFPLLPWGETQSPDASLAIDDAVLVDEALDLIADEELITAICSVSTGNYSFMSSR